jgi:hypothetical protein
MTRGADLTADGVISLADLIEANDHGSGDYVTSLCLFDGGNVTGNPPLPSGGKAAFKFQFQLMPETNNKYQGDIATFGVNFIATAIDEYPDPNLVESILEPLVEP